MRQIEDYIALARARQDIPSDTQLCRRMGFKGHPITMWRTRRTWPSDESMVALARMAGMDPRIALIELNIWRASGAARFCYQEMLERLPGALGILALLFVLSTGYVQAAPSKSDLAPIRPAPNGYCILWRERRKSGYFISLYRKIKALANGVRLSWNRPFAVLPA